MQKGGISRCQSLVNSLCVRDVHSAVIYNYSYSRRLCYEEIILNGPNKHNKVSMYKMTASIKNTIC
jgi:hypothetical protein